MTLDIDTSAIDDPIKRKRREEFERLSRAFWKLCRSIDQEYANYGEALTGVRIAANRARGEVMDPDKRVGGERFEVSDPSTGEALPYPEPSDAEREAAGMLSEAESMKVVIGTVTRRDRDVWQAGRIYEQCLAAERVPTDRELAEQHWSEQEDGARAASKLREAVGFLRSCIRSGEQGADHPLVVDAIAAYDAALGGEAEWDGLRVACNALELVGNFLAAGPFTPERIGIIRRRVDEALASLDALSEHPDPPKDESWRSYDVPHMRRRSAEHPETGEREAALSRALDAFVAAYGQRITWSEVLPIVAKASGLEPDYAPCVVCRGRGDLFNGGWKRKSCEICHETGLTGELRGFVRAAPIDFPEPLQDGGEREPTPMHDRCRATFKCRYSNAEYVQPCDRCPYSDVGPVRHPHHDVEPQTAMRAVLLAYEQTRDECGHWAKGAATHVFAALLGKLSENGWVLARAAPDEGEER